MAMLYVVQTGRTIWEEQARVESAAGAPLSDVGTTAVEDTAKQLVGQKITAIYASAGEAEHQTAKLVAKILRLKVRTEDRLGEIDYGLWQGLTIDEIRRRQPKRYRQWTESPASVRPPGGETLSEAQQRLRGAVKEILKRQKQGSSLVVLRPIMVGLLRCMISGKELDTLWDHVDPTLTWESYNTDGKNL
jgi:broad specificity phosphatase PhoE